MTNLMIEELKSENKQLRNFILSQKRRSVKIKALGKYNHIFMKNNDNYKTLCEVASIQDVDQMKINFEKSLCSSCEKKFNLLVKR